MSEAAKKDLATYTFDRHVESGLWTIVGRWPDMTTVMDTEGTAEWAFPTIEEARAFWKALIVVHEDRGYDSRFVDLSEVKA